MIESLGTYADVVVAVFAVSTLLVVFGTGCSVGYTVSVTRPIDVKHMTLFVTLTTLACAASGVCDFMLIVLTPMPLFIAIAVYQLTLIVGVRWFCRKIRFSCFR